MVGDCVEDFALLEPRLYVQNVVGEICGMVSVGELSLQDVVFGRCWFARGDGSVEILGLGSRVRGNDGVGFGDFQVRVFEGRGLRLTLALVARDTSVVWEFVVRRVHVEYARRISIHVLEMSLIAYHR